VFTGGSLRKQVNLWTSTLTLIWRTDLDLEIKWNFTKFTIRTGAILSVYEDGRIEGLLFSPWVGGGGI
jgi:glutathione peroxidase-family protein